MYETTRYDEIGYWRAKPTDFDTYTEPDTRTLSHALRHGSRSMQSQYPARVAVHQWYASGHDGRLACWRARTATRCRAVHTSRCKRPGLSVRSASSFPWIAAPQPFRVSVGHAPAHKPVAHHGDRRHHQQSLLSLDCGVLLSVDPSPCLFPL